MVFGGFLFIVMPPCFNFIKEVVVLLLGHSTHFCFANLTWRFFLLST